MPDLTFAQKKALSQSLLKAKEPDWWDQTKGFASAVPVGLTDLPLTVEALSGLLGTAR